jgi:hypothetical protein
MVTPDLNGTNVSCEYDNARATTEESIGIYLITLTSGKESLMAVI